jgi:hypothetical protein
MRIVSARKSQLLRLFSSYSDSWLVHAAHYMEVIVQRVALSQSSYVVELASNDG